MKKILVIIATLTAVLLGMGLTVRNDKNPTGELDQEGYLLRHERPGNENEYGNAFTASFFIASTFIGDEQSVLAQTGNKTVCIAMTWYISNKCDLQIYRGSTLSISAYTMETVCSNRASSASSTLSMWLSPSYTAASAGKLIYTFNDMRGNRVQLLDGMILKKNTRYLMRAANGTGKTDTSATFSWYEY